MAKNAIKSSCTPKFVITTGIPTNQEILKIYHRKKCIVGIVEN